MPTRIGGTRWLSHTLLAIENLWKGYKGIVQHLDQCWQQDTKLAPKANGMFKQLRSNSVVSYGHFMQDELSVLSIMSRELQKKDASIYTCHAILETTKTSLKKLEERPGFHMEKLTNMSESFQGETLVGTFTYPTAIVSKLYEALENRYRDVSMNILGATKVAYLASWPIDL